MRLLLASILILKWSLRHASARVSQNLLLQLVTTSPPHLQVRAWWPRGIKHTLWTQGTDGTASSVKAQPPLDGYLELWWLKMKATTLRGDNRTHEAACGERAGKSLMTGMNSCLSALLDSTFWRMGDATVRNTRDSDLTAPRVSGTWTRMIWVCGHTSAACVVLPQQLQQKMPWVVRNGPRCHSMWHPRWAAFHSLSHGTKVMPSGLLPSDLNTSDGSRWAGSADHSAYLFLIH